jgi:ligand-binding sensor domain-containing protein/signal transduction histidine kinase
MATAPHWSAASEGIETEFVIRTWDRRGGLPPTVIHEIQRTPNGYLWLATRRGLVRFDGERFKMFTTANHPEMRTNHVSSVLADAGGGVWIGTLAGLFHCPAGSLGTEAWLEIGSHLPVKALVAGKPGVVWVLTLTNEAIEIVGGKVQTSFKVPGDKPMHRLLYDEREGLMVAATDHALLLREGRWLPLPREIIAGLRPHVGCLSKHGGFWLAANRDAARLTGMEEGFKLMRLDSSGEVPQTRFSTLMEDHSGRLWAGTVQGAVYCIQPTEAGSEGAGGRPVWREVTPPRRAQTLGDISCLYEDAEGLIWAGTTSGYLHQIKRRQLTWLSLPTLTQESVPHTVCVARDGSVWIGTDGAGVYRYQDGAISRFDTAQGLGNGTVITILEDRQAHLWFGTLGGLFRLENERFKAELESVLQNQPVPALFQDRADNLWFGSVGAVSRKRGDEVTTYRLPAPFQDREVRAIVEDRRGELWIGTRGGGIFRLQEGKVEKFARFQPPRVHVMHCDERGVLWVGTATRGLFRVTGNRRPYSWTRADGLPSAWIQSILEDSNGTLWLGSNEGIFGVTKQALAARERSKDSPLLTIHVASSETGHWSVGSGQPSAAQGPDGRLWFPAGHGVLAFHPSELMRPRPALPVLIEEVLVDGVARAFTGEVPLRIYTGLKRLEFRYTIADLDAPGQLKFRYKLEGVDEGWVNSGAQRSASYGSLPPGQYQFRVISAGSANVWTETATPLAFEIVPHFWETAWFRALVALLVLNAVGATAHFMGRAKLRRKLERLEMQQATEKERHRIAQDLHDDLGSGITEIMLLSELAKRAKAELPGEIHAQLSNITQKARQVATAMDEVVWTVNPQNDVVPNLASYLCDYAREFFRAVPAHCRIDIAEDLPSYPLAAQTRHNFFLAVKEALHNAAKHAGADEVWLRLHCNGNRFVVTVEDNGQGFDPATTNGAGNGLQNMRERLKAAGGQTDIQSRPGGGTMIRFSLPLPSME